MPTAEQIQDAIATVHNQESFIKNLLIDALGWKIPEGTPSVEEISYPWTATELNAEGLDKKIVDGQIWQIQPLEENRSQPWGIFVLEFTSKEVFTTGRGLTGPLRKILRGLVPKARRDSNLPAWNRENLLFICTHNYQHYRFAYFKAPQEKAHTAPLITFGWEPDTPARTACEHNLIHLTWPDEPEDSDKWISHWAKAFDVELVTKKFYDAYEQVFTNLQAQLDLPSDEDKKMFAQVLMNRLMFLRFIERKGWLRLNDGNPKEYLKNLYQAGRLNNLSWYRSRLQVLFFEGLAVPNHNRENVIGTVPYLNGGLFTITEWDDRAGDIEDRVFEPILGQNGLLYRYNFTVEESTPLDIEVAVDPEMLGKVFEKLVTARRQSGSYYTPRTVVQFMCRESLKSYLGSQYASLVDEHKTDNIFVPQAKELLEKLDNIKVVDPACGSGAYLLGMLQELFTLSKILDTRAETHDPHNAYQRKLQIICNNIYGVDSDDFAVGIARLRLWLSLAVDFTGDHPDPLPNLDFKIETGDSLIAPDPTGLETDLFRRQKIQKFDHLKALFIDPVQRASNPNLESKIQEVRQEILNFTHPGQATNGFDWRVEFAEVFSNGGFDIVIANPPYGIKVDDSVRNQYFNQRIESEKGQSKDSYGIFLARGLQLLRPNGTLSYIVSDTWRTIKSHKPLRKRILENTTVFHILDLPSWIFDATVNTGIITFRKAQAAEDHQLIAGDLRGIVQDDWKALSDNLIAVSGHGPDIQTLNCARYTYHQKRLCEYSNLSFFIASPKMFTMMNNPSFTRFGNIGAAVHGISTGANHKYVRMEPGTRGNLPEIEDWMKMPVEEMSRLTDDEKVNGVDRDWKLLTKCFVPFEKGGESDAAEGWLPNYYVPTKYYINWANSAIADMRKNKGVAWKNERYFFKQGLTFSISGIYSPTFRLNSEGVFEAKGSGIFCDSMDLEVLLGLFCSMVARYQFKSYIKHSVDTSGDNINEFRFPQPDSSIVARIKKLVGSITKKQMTQQDYPYHLHEQKEIDTLVYQLYELNEEDIREIELWYCRRYRRLAEAQGLLAEVKQKYAAHLERCKRIIEKPPSYWRSNPILQLISQGETHNLEFKETLFVNTHTGSVDEGVFHSSLKTIAAYLNTSGGTLLIGVHDSGEIKGIDRDIRASGGRRNRDSFELKLRNVLSGDNSRFAPAALGHCQISYEELAEGTICKVDVMPMAREETAHLDGDVFVRDGNRTIQLTGPELTRWIRQRTT